MTVLLIDEEIPAGVAQGPRLPEVFTAAMTDTDEPVHGDLRDPSQALLGDYVLGESGRWLRVLDVQPSDGGWRVLVGRLPGAWLPVPAGRQVWVWPAADVMAWAVLSESAGGAR